MCSVLYHCSDPDGASVLPFPSYKPANNIVLVKGFTQNLANVVVAPGQKGDIKNLKYTVKSDAIETLARSVRVCILSCDACTCTHGAYRQ